MEGTFYCDFRRVNRPRLSPYKERRAAFPDSIRQTRAADQQLPVPVLLGDSPMKAIAGAKGISQQAIIAVSRTDSPRSDRRGLSSN